MKDVRKQKYEAPRRRFPTGANVTVTAVQERSLGCARDDDTGNGESKFENEDEKPRVTRRLGDYKTRRHQTPVSSFRAKREIFFAER